MKLDARVSTGPSGVANLVPQLARRDGLGHFAIGAADQFPRQIVFDSLQEGIRHPHRVVRVLARNRHIGLGIPIGVIGGKLDRGEALLGVLQDAEGVGVGDHGLFGRFDRRFQRGVLGRINRIFRRPIPCANGGENLVQARFMRLGTGDQRGHLLLFDHFPVDESFHIGVIHIADHHLGRTACGAARFDSARSTVADFQKAHQARRLAAARQMLSLAAQRREVGAGARTVFEQACFTHPQIHNPAIAHQIIAHRLNKAGVRLGVFIGRVRLGQHFGLVIDIVVAL